MRWFILSRYFIMKATFLMLTYISSYSITSKPFEDKDDRKHYLIGLKNKNITKPSKKEGNGLVLQP